MDRQLIYNARFSAFVFRTRGLYMFIALTASMVSKFYQRGTTSWLLLVVAVIMSGVVQAFRIYSGSYLWGRQAVSRVEADFLCTSGPYAYVRNPLYLGNFLIGLGVSLAINEWYAYALFIISYVFVYSIVIPYEEAFLHEKFGNRYEQYKAQTRRLVPRLRTYRSYDKVIPDYRAGVLGEAHIPIILAIIFIIISLLFVR